MDKLRQLVTRFAGRNPSAHGAFYAMHPHRIRGTLGLWQTQLHNVKPFYAVKCNPEPQFLNALFDSGIGFDCASERELLSIKELSRGDVRDRIVYANPCKSERDLRAAKSLGAPMTVVDSVEEVEKLAAGGGYEGGALVRIAVDDTASAMPFSTKFGCAIEGVTSVADAARALKIPLKGISFHVGSGGAGGGMYSAAINRAYASLGLLRLGGHYGANVIDLGGGYLADQRDFQMKALEIRGAMSLKDADEADAGRRGGLKWIAEPGRFFASSAFDFFVQVIGKKKGGPGGAWKYTVDDSLYGQFSSILFDYAEPTWVRVSDEKGLARRRSPGVLFGRTCDSVDVIARAADMEELEVGDWLWFPRMGAYTRATASEFNGFPTPEVLIAEDGEREEGGIAEEYEFRLAAPKGVTRMPPVSARAFWAAGPGGKN